MKLIPRFRRLAWFNILAAALLLGPAAIGITLDFISRPTILSEWTSRPLEETLAEIESINDLDRLRQMTVMMQRSLYTDAQAIRSMSRVSDQLMKMLAVFMCVAGIGFLANAAFLMWSLRKQITAEQNAL